MNQAAEIVDAALSTARELDLRPLTITVLDPGGHPIVVKREDGAGILRPQIAHAKAWGCLGTGQGGATGARHATRDPAFFTALAAISEGRIASSRGGVLIRDAQGALLGAIGVSGDRPENDETVAIAGVQKAGLVADAGASPREG
ncbi:MAG TPA: heme-binding protein [Pseudonocardiaceae bacterium]|nr:heme-binding protein [Pseudonocardiaceae bacterium]